MEPARGADGLGARVAEVVVEVASGVDHTLPDEDSSSELLENDDGHARMDHDSHELDGSDTESLGGSEASGEVEPESVPEPEVAYEGFRANSAAIRVAFQGLDAVELPLMFNRRAQVMKNIPYFLQGAFRNCLRLAMEEACQADHIRCERGWKLFMLLPRMPLHRPPRGGNIPRHKLQE